jgi:putative Mg2+ transporter-C (MgtC) family protein
VKTCRHGSRAVHAGGALRVRGRSRRDRRNRVAAQVVTGIGFIGAGVIFTRRDGVRGLTMAATIWLTAAVGSRQGRGSWRSRPPQRRSTWSSPSCTHRSCGVCRPLSTHLTSFRVSYEDGHGVLRDVMATTTGLGYVMSNVGAERSDHHRDIVSVSMDAEGRRRPEELVDALQQVHGVVDVRSTDPTE